MTYDFVSAPESMDEFWMPFTPQRYFKKSPRMVSRADGMYYYDEKGKQILDGFAGLWCVNAGHNQPKINEAIKTQLETLDYMSSFQYGSPTSFTAATRLIELMPKPFTKVFFSSSGSEAVETALKIALNYQRLRGEGSRKILIGRERAYHGMNYGGISIGGIPPFRNQFGQLLPSVVHLPHTHNLEHNSFVRGEPEWGGHLADTLETQVAFYGANNIAAVIVEPVAGATGVLPPPKGYLKKLREICDKHDILLIFDEVVTGVGRMGVMSAAEYFGVMPDMITMAKGISNGTVPLGATFVQQKIYDAFMKGAEHDIELMHGYTYSGHPLASAACIGTLDTIKEQKIWENARKMMKPFEEAVHSLKNKPHVVDIRNCGMVACVQLAPTSKEDPAKFARELSWKLFEDGAVVRYSGPQLYFCPPLILNEKHIDQLFTMTAKAMDALAAKKAA